MQVERVAGQMIAVSPLRILCNDPVKSSCGILSCRPCKNPDVHFAAICRSLPSIRVCANETIQFLMRPHNDSGGCARQPFQTRRYSLCYRRRRSLCIHHRVAALDVGFHFFKSERRQHLLEVRHRQLSGAANVNRAKKNHISWHAGTCFRLYGASWNLKSLVPTYDPGADASVARELELGPRQQPRTKSVARAKILDELKAQFRATTLRKRLPSGPHSDHEHTRRNLKRSPAFPAECIYVRANLASIGYPLPAPPTR